MKEDNNPVQDEQTQADLHIESRTRTEGRSITGGEPGSAGVFWLSSAVDEEQQEARVALMKGSEQLLEVTLEAFFLRDRLQEFRAPTEQEPGFNASIEVIVDWGAKRLESNGRFILMPLAKEEKQFDCNYTLQLW